MKLIYNIQRILVKIFRCLCEWTIRFSRGLYRILYLIEWKFLWGGAEPLSFDHNIDLMYLWEEGATDWLERGVYNLFCIHQFEKPKIIELGCADGFYTYKFYSVVSDACVIACDKDKYSIRCAMKKHIRNNIKYIYSDFLHQMPYEKDITNVIWDASINFFTQKEQEKIIKEISDILSMKKGILSGCGVVERGEKWGHYVTLFSSFGEVELLLKKYFTNVYVFGTNSRKEIVYFWATNGELPLTYKQK